MTDEPRPVVPPLPAIGAVTWRGGRPTLALVVAVVVLAVALLGVRASGVLREEGPLPPLPEVATVAPGILRGAQPTDADLQRLRDDDGLRGAVAVGGSSVETQAAARTLGVPLHDVAVDPATGLAPAAEVAALVQFLHQVAPDHGLVYVYDVTGTGPVVPTALMLALLDGRPLAAVLDDLDPATRAALRPPVQAALAQVAATRTDPAAAGPYAPLAGVRL